MTRGVVVLLGLIGCARVHNGTVVDIADIPLAGATKLHLPASAVLTRAGPAGVMRVEMTKRLGFRGHPPRSMSIAAGRRLMGVATRRSGDVLVLATFGDFATIEDGASLELAVRVPPGVDVEKKSPRLGGRARLARRIEQRAADAGQHAPLAAGDRHHHPQSSAFVT